MKKKLTKKFSLTKQEQALQCLIYNSEIGNFQSLSTIQQFEWNRIKEDDIGVKRAKQKVQEKKQKNDLSLQKIKLKLQISDKKQFKLKKKSFQTPDHHMFLQTQRNSNFRKLLSLQMINRKYYPSTPHKNPQEIESKQNEEQQKMKLAVNDFSFIKQKLSQLCQIKTPNRMKEKDHELQSRQKLNSMGFSRYRRKFHQPHENYFLKTREKFH